MQFDLVVRNGLVIDGSGSAAVRADVGVVGDRIVEVGRIRTRGQQDLDAEGHIVTPGFIDGHTHMDAQIFWDPLGSCSCWNGVTTVVMGNCGFSLAPVRPDTYDAVIRNIERAEDISRPAMAAGIECSWDSFGSYLGAIDRLPKAINYATQVGHCALRTLVMGERAFEEKGTDDEVEAMESHLREAFVAGAIGFTTSRTPGHMTMDDKPVASRLAEWSEISRLVAVAGQMGGVFELATPPEATTADETAAREWTERISSLAVMSGAPITFGVLDIPENPQAWTDQLGLLDQMPAAGGQMFGLAHSREIAILFSFKTRLPFDSLPLWSEIRSLPLAQQRVAYLDPDLRRRLVAAAHAGPYPKIVDSDMSVPNYDILQVMRTAAPGNPTIAEVARGRAVDPVEVMIDLGLETDFDQFFMKPLVNRNMDAVLAIMRHPRTVMTFSDAGAHVSQIMDSSIQVNLLSYWVREREALRLEEAIRMVTLDPALAWGFADRGLLREGMTADLNVIDPARVKPELPYLANDLPSGAARLIQKSIGIRATVVAGQVVFVDGDHTGALPGRILRSGSSDRPRRGDG
jgi:N-acyl-D-amino-acid deacylase